ncbi:MULTISPECIES: hypothetical protein [unclassified Bradyrhizobium]|uniref:hypothetical protein n=1 Tax=unclassified Bradyrhizobium TaxID=2631580 RepID=UPI0029162B33|nr:MULTISPECIES: hypothetical protein [unclassified Bradyrhizobium]
MLTAPGRTALLQGFGAAVVEPDHSEISRGPELLADAELNVPSKEARLNTSTNSAAVMRRIVGGNVIFWALIEGRSSPLWMGGAGEPVWQLTSS